MTAMIRVRVNPTDPGQYVIYADPEDPSTSWVGQADGGRYLGWMPDAVVADWPEFELAIPSRAVRCGASQSDSI